MLAATTASIMVIGIIYYAGIYFIKDNIMKNEMNNNQVYLEYSYAYLENLMKTLKDVMYSIENDNDLNDLMLSTDSDIMEKYIQINDMCKKLALIKPTINEAAVIYTYLNNAEILLMPNGTYDSGLFFLSYYQGSVDQWKNILMNPKHSNNLEVWDLSLNKDINASRMGLSRLNVVKSLYMNGLQRGAIVVNLRNDFIDRLYAGRDFAVKRKIYITDPNLKVILSNDTDNAVKLALPDHLKEKGTYEDGNGYIVTFRKSEQNNMFFFVAVPKEVVFENIKYIEAISFTILVIILFIGLLMSVYLSQRFYLPISEVLNDLEKLSCFSGEIMHRQNEMGYIKSNFMKIYSSNNTLESTVKEGMPVLVDIILLKIMLGDKEVDNAIALCERFSIDFRKGFYVVIVIRFTNQYKGEFRKGIFELNSTIKQTLSKYHMGTYKLAEDEFSIVMFMENDADRGYLMSMIRELYSKMDEEDGYNPVIIGVGTIVNNIFELDRSRSDAAKAIQNRRVMDDSTIVELLTGDYDESNKVNIPIDMEQRLTNFVQSGSIDAAEQYAGEVLDINYRRNVTYASYYNLCNSMQNILVRIINQCDAGNGIPGENVSNMLERIDTIYDVMLLSERILLNIKTVSSYFFNKKRNNSSFERIIEYVDRNFMMDINLDTVANKFGYNANYLSKSVKQLKGMSFSEYLIKKRIEHSKKLLVESQRSIKDIAEESGYHSSSIFIRAFSKITGMTPSEYRRKATL